MYPLTTRIEAVAFAPQLASQPPFDKLPSMQLLSDGVSESGSGRRRLHLRLDTVAPCWGAMNMTGSLVGWSFAPDLPISATSQVPLHAVISFATPQACCTVDYIRASNVMQYCSSERNIRALGHCSLQDGTPQHVVRIAGNSGSEEWLFWVDVEQVTLGFVLVCDTAADSSTVRRVLRVLSVPVSAHCLQGGHLFIEVAVTYWERSTAALDKFVTERLPKWTTLLWGVTMHSEWSF
jgi:hypothetical protein